MGAVAQALGKGSILPYQGKDYPLAPWTLNVQGDFELHLEQEARKQLRAACKELMPDEASDMRRVVMQDITAGVYSFGGSAAFKSMTSARHMPYLLYLQLRDGAKSEDRHLITPELARQMAEEDADACLDAMTSANPTKPAKTPETPTTPMTSTL
jgi:hypothetical protein